MRVIAASNHALPQDATPSAEWPPSASAVCAPRGEHGRHVRFIRRISRASRKAQAVGSFTALADQIRAAGLLRRRYGYYWSKLAGLPLAVLVMLAIFVWIGDTWWQLFTAVGFGILFAQVAFLGHGR